MEKPKNLKAILFDLDGTLVNLPIDYKRMRKRLKDLFIDYGIKSDFRPLIQSIEKCISKLKLKRISNKEKRKIRNLSYEIIDDEELNSVKKSHLIPGSEELLKFCKKRKIKIVIFTRNGSKCVKAVFKKYKLPKPDLIASRDKVNKLKPNREHIFYILNRLKISKDECIIIGDSSHDIDAGKKMNMVVIWLKKTN